MPGSATGEVLQGHRQLRDTTHPHRPTRELEVHHGCLELMGGSLDRLGPDLQGGGVGGAARGDGLNGFRTRRCGWAVRVSPATTVTSSGSMPTCAAQKC